MRRTRAVVGVAAAVGLLGVSVPRVCAQSQTVYHDRLDTTSQLTEMLCVGPCLCPRHDYSGGASGGMTVTRLQPDPLFEHFAVSDVHLAAVLNGQTVTLVGSGSYRIGGEVALLHELILDLSVDGAAPPRHFDSGLVIAQGRAFPHIDIVLDTTETNLCSAYHLELFTSVLCPADWDGDGQVDPADVAAFVNSWLSSLQRGTLDGDFDGNGRVEPADVAAFVSAWFGALGGGC